MSRRYLFIIGDHMLSSTYTKFRPLFRIFHSCKRVLPLLFPLERSKTSNAGAHHAAGTYLWIAATEALLCWIRPGLATIVTKEQGQTPQYIFLHILTDPHSPFSHFFRAVCGKLQRGFDTHELPTFKPQTLVKPYKA